jgi:hypothetical protein
MAAAHVPADASLKRPTLLALAGGGAVIGALGLVFGLLVHPQKPDGCETGLYPGLYGDLLVPAHLAAFAALALLVGWLDARRRGGRPQRWTVRALAVLAALVLASFPLSVLIAAPAFLALVIVMPVGAILAVVALVRVARVQGSRAAADVRWARHAGTVEMVLWALLALGLPAVFAGSYINGAGLFCF